jgi:hypothetical protein
LSSARTAIGSDGFGEALEIVIGGCRAFDDGARFASVSWPRSFVSGSPPGDGGVGLTAGGVVVIGPERGFRPRGSEHLQRARRVELRLLVGGAEEFHCAFPFAALGRDHGAPQGGGLVAAQDAAREIIVGFSLSGPAM